MDVLILGPLAGREKDLPDIFTARGFKPKVVPDGKIDGAVTKSMVGLLLLEASGRSNVDLLRRCRQVARKTQVPFLVVAQDFAREHHARLRAGGATLVCDPDVSNERIVAEFESRRDLNSADPQVVRQQMLQPFIAAAMEAAQIMANANIKAKNVYRKRDYSMKGDVSALIYLIAKVERILAISFPLETSRDLTKRVLGGIVSEITDDMVFDCSAEFVNIVAGQVMGTYTGTPFEFDISTPTIVSGPSHEIRHQRDLPCFVVDMDGDMGGLALQLCVRSTSEPGA